MPAIHIHVHKLDNAQSLSVLTCVPWLLLLVRSKRSMKLPGLSHASSQLVSACMCCSPTASSPALLLAPADDDDRNHAPVGAERNLFAVPPLWNAACRLGSVFGDGLTYRVIIAPECSIEEEGCSINCCRCNSIGGG